MTYLELLEDFKTSTYKRFSTFLKTIFPPVEEQESPDLYTDYRDNQDRSGYNKFYHFHMKNECEITSITCTRPGFIFFVHNGNRYSYAIRKKEFAQGHSSIRSKNFNDIDKDTYSDNCLNVHMTFGKYIGQKLVDIPIQYLAYMVNKTTNQVLKQQIEFTLNHLRKIEEDLVETLSIEDYKNYTLKFGKYKSTKLSELNDLGYVMWVKMNTDDKKVMKFAMMRYHELKEIEAQQSVQKVETPSELLTLVNIN